MSTFGGMNVNGDARRAHLALINGGAASSGVSNLREGAAVVRPTAPTSISRAAATTYGQSTGGVEASRSRHERGVRAVAQNFPDFESALLPMVLASGVAGESAAAVAEAIMNTPALKAQAERAFQRSRLDAV